MNGALHGLRVIEIGGLGPAPFATMMLADHGADVLRIERPDKAPDSTTGSRPGLTTFDVLNRNRPAIGVDLKAERGVDLLLELCETADVLIEGFRPGVAERLGFGPDVVLDRNPRIVYARMTGWGQTGPMANRAGHDINYISLAGAQAHIGRADQPPTPPLSLVGDFGGGGMLLAFGVCAAIISRSMTGRGQVVDAAMVDGSALLMAPLFGAHQTGFWSDDRGMNLLDSGAPFYDCYQCADGKWVSVGAIEPQFFANLLHALDLDPTQLPAQAETARWADLRDAITARFASHDRDHWERIFESTDACVTPVLSMGEVPTHPHIQHRQTIVNVEGSSQPSPAPRFSYTPALHPTPASVIGSDTHAALERWHINGSKVDALVKSGVVV